MPTRLLLALLLSACASPHRQYVNTYWGSTEKLELFDGLGTALRLDATYLSDTFRVAMADERARLIGQGTDDHARFKDNLLDDGRTYHEIVFAAESSYDKNDLDFGEADDGWQIRLEADGTPEPLVTVYRVRTPTVLHGKLFAGLNRYNQLWIAKFERTVAAPQEVVLYVGGGHGNGSLRWGSAQLR